MCKSTTHKTFLSLSHRPMKPLSNCKQLSPHSKSGVPKTLNTLQHHITYLHNTRTFRVKRMCSCVRVCVRARIVQSFRPQTRPPNTTAEDHRGRARALVLAVAHTHAVAQHAEMALDAVGRPRAPQPTGTSDGVWGAQFMCTHVRPGLVCEQHKFHTRGSSINMRSLAAAHPADADA